MPKQHIESYVNAMLALSQELKKTKQFLEDAILFRKIAFENPEFVNLLKSHFISTKDKHTIIDKVFSNFFSIYMKNFFHVLLDRKVIFYIEEINEGFIKQVDEILNIRDVYIYSTAPMPNKQILRIKSYIEEKYKIQAYVHNRIDPSLIGGIKIVLSDIVIDNSINFKLKEICNELIETRK